MKIKTTLFILSIAAGVLFQSCHKKSNQGPDDPPVGKPAVTRIEDVLNGKDQSLINILNKVRGSVGKRGPASKTIWSRKNDYGVGLYISANHIYNISGWSSRNAQFFNLFSENPGIFETSQIPPANGNITLGNTLIADFPLMHFDISPNATNTTILPSEDFYLGVIDNQRIEQGPLPQYPNVVQTAAPLQMYDADNRTKAIQTWAVPVAGEKAIAVGYPQDNSNYPNGAVAYGKILSDTEAADIIQKLKAAGDTEGDVPYNPDVEFFVEAQGIAGMSGGGAFNSEGQLLGIMVRASDKEKAPKIIRVVKVVYIKSRMVEFYNGLPETSKSKVRPFISGEL
ncbi:MULTISPECIES: hypothetical protein [unclassified Chitinophaga]|uniref:hypothetical protein n=1 Tax=unclassified Chitinophaga TaxID=2619133 RepID=UPI0030105B99